VASGALLAASLVDVAMGVAFGLVARVILRRPVSLESRAGARAFAVWWAGIGFLVAFEGIRGVVAAVTGSVGVVFAVIWYAWIVALAGSMWGLVVYLAYVYTGTHRVAVPLALFYSAWSAFALWQTARAVPVFMPSDLAVFTSYQTPIPEGVEVAFFAFLYLPQLVGIALYARLYGKAAEPFARFRIASTSIALGLWLGINFFASVADWTEIDAWQIGRRALGLAASLAILLAHAPPPAIRRAFALT